MIDVAFDSKKFENKLAIFSAGLGSFYASLMRGVGDRIASIVPVVPSQFLLIFNYARYTSSKSTVNI